MRPVIEKTLVSQTTFYDEANDTRGNCLQAAVASYFDLLLEDVPHFLLFADAWMDALRIWSYAAVHHDMTHQDVSEVPDEPCVLIGKSPRGVHHAVLADRGAIIWDPHPSRVGLTTIKSAFFFEPQPGFGPAE